LQVGRTEVLLRFPERIAMCEFTIKCGGKFDIYFNNDDVAHHVTVKVHDECEGENNFPIVQVLNKDGTALKPEKTQTMSPGGGITTFPVKPGEMVRITCLGTGEGKRCRASAQEKEK
jgi:hypothetical protein